LILISSFLIVIPRDLPPELQTKVEIEMSQLRLLERHRQARANVAHEIRRAIAIDTCCDPLAFKRARIKEKLTQVDKYKQDQEGGRKKKHSEFINVVMAHYKQFKEFHAANAREMRKINRYIVSHHVTKARREQQLRERQEKERLKALKVFFIHSFIIFNFLKIII
jgi:hypothetical protein